MAVTLDPERVVKNPAPVVQALRALRVWFLDCVLVGRLPRRVGSIEPNLLRRIGVSGVRAFLRENSGPHALKRALGQAGLLPTDVARWLRLRLDDSSSKAVAGSLAMLACGREVDARTFGTCRRILRGGGGPFPSQVDDDR